MEKTATYLKIRWRGMIRLQNAWLALHFKDGKWSAAGCAGS
jgi:hypothetical protein